MKRSAGILLSVSSLPSAYGIGCFSESAYRFVDWLQEAGQTYWQILPLGPTSYGDSPYQSFSTFAGNPYFIDLTSLIAEGLLTKEECEQADLTGDSSKVDYGKQYVNRYPLLRKAYARAALDQHEKFLKFCKENDWLEDYALFMAVKDQFHGISWNEWEDDIRLRKPEALKHYREMLWDEIRFYQFLQYQFYHQWKKLKSYANDRGIQIIGDIPIYVAFDSADAWASPELFQLDENNLPSAVAGCPPDGFSATGQLWGNPLYRWDYHKETGYQWWIRRMRHCFELYDVVRIDHFRGFDEYYSIPYGEPTAMHGHWEKGPGIDLFQAIEKALGKKDVIAEDLGFLTETSRKLVKDSGFPNMKVLEFAFDARDAGGAGEYLPYTYGENCVAYTGTHDNQTIRSWFRTITEEERKMVREYTCDFYTPDEEISWVLIGNIMRSKANLCIVPMQDYLGLDDRCRMNTPSTVGENWKWRMDQGALTEELKERIRTITGLCQR